jgi:hypothetical protein
MNYNSVLYRKHLLSGGSFLNWLKLLVVNGGVDRPYLPQALTVSQLSFLTIYLRIVEQVRFGWQIENCAIAQPPIFIIGHWRSGTTYLLNLITQDNSLGYISRFQAFRGSEIFLSYPDLAKRWTHEDFSGQRISDNIIMSAYSPCEEEFALANSSVYSFYHGFYFPKNMKEIFQKWALFETVDKSEQAAWKKAYMKLVKKVTLGAAGKRLVLKNPLNTARIPVLLEMFPEAKFIHIYRNPYKIYASAHQLFQRLVASLGLQSISESEISHNIIFFYQQMMQKFLNDRQMIKPDNLVEIKYEDFVGNELAVLQHIYNQFDLPGFEDAKDNFSQYLQSQASYQVNQYELQAKTIDTITEAWKFAFEVWPYDLPDDIKAIGTA